MILESHLDGIAIGGEVIGYDMPQTCEVLSWLRPMLPMHKLRYTMGVGLRPQDLIDVVKEGVDMFDCVAPTRNARHGALFCGEFKKVGDWFTFSQDTGADRILIKKAEFSKDESPIMEDCTCYTCQHHSRGYLHYLFKMGATAFIHLATIHNVHVMNEVCRKMREAIKDKKNAIQTN